MIFRCGWRCEKKGYETLIRRFQTSASRLSSNSNRKSDEFELFRRAAVDVGGAALVPNLLSVGADMLMETGENGMGSGREAGAGGVAGLATLEESPMSVSASVSSSMSQNEEGPSLAPLPSSAARAWTLLDILTEGVMDVDLVRNVRLEMLRRCACCD